MNPPIIRHDRGTLTEKRLEPLMAIHLYLCAYYEEPQAAKTVMSFLEGECEHHAVGHEDSHAWHCALCQVPMVSPNFDEAAAKAGEALRRRLRLMALEVMRKEGSPEGLQELCIEIEKHLPGINLESGPRRSEP